MKLANVALATSAPPNPSGSPNSDRSQSSATVSTEVANSDAARENAFWSSSETVQSAASAAGVTPPVTKWKNRGPAEWVADAVPTDSSRSATAAAPSPTPGSSPPSSPTRAEPAYTGRVASEDR